MPTTLKTANKNIKGRATPPNMIKILSAPLNAFIKFGKKVGEFNSKVLLTAVYITAIGITAIIAKAVRKHFLELKIQPEKQSYWINREQKQTTMEEFKRSF